MQDTIALSLVMAGIAVVNALLMAWLWRFPMRPDPDGRDPNGVSTAPRSWTNVHRGLGYVFIVAYALLLVEMVPRAWQFRVATPISIIHGSLGMLIGLLLVIKIAIIRRFRACGNRLPWIGGTLAIVTLTVALLGVIPAWMVLRPLTDLPPELVRGREVVSHKCNQCHGASMIAGEDEDARKWGRITREMQRLSHTIDGKNPITDSERIAATAYLASVLGEDDDDGSDDSEEVGDADDRRRRGRGRGRGGR